MISVAVAPRGASKTIAKVQKSESGDLLEHNVCFKEKTTSATCPSPVAPLGEKSAKFFNQINSAANNALNTNAFDNVQFDQDVELVGLCNTATLVKGCMASYTNVGSKISSKSAKKKAWMTYESLANGFEVTFDDKSMGNPTAKTIAAAMHNTANTVTNEWTNGTTANKLSAKVQSYVKKANGYGSAATSTST